MGRWVGIEEHRLINHTGGEGPIDASVPEFLSSLVIESDAISVEDMKNGVTLCNTLLTVLQRQKKLRQFFLRLGMRFT